jgi:uncharacterized protein (TIGR03435 family)
MLRWMSLSLMLLASGTVEAQLEVPGFEVASIKVDTAGTDEGPGKGRELVHITPDGLTMRNIRMRSAMKWAYSVQTEQISGPAWIDSERYVILTKTGSEAPEERLRLMLRKLLTERFQMTVHWEAKELRVYALAVGSGPKLRPSNDKGEGGVKFGDGNSAVAANATLTQFADSLTNALRAIVLDETGLKGPYSFTLDLNRYQTGDILPDEMPGLMARGLRDELGLKLESVKRRVAMLIVDRANKTPAAN